MTWQGWTDENTALLRKLDAEGLSCSQIAKRLGAPSRNSIIAKRWRLGLGLPLDVVRAKRADAVRGRARAVIRSAKTYKLAGSGSVFEQAECPPPRVVVEFSEGPGGQRIIDPGFTGCRWPIGGEGAETRHCCEPRPAGSTYCEAHARMAYNIRTPEQKAADAARAARAREGKRRGRAA